jgi:hypothetical protein
MMNFLTIMKFRNLPIVVRIVNVIKNTNKFNKNPHVKWGLFFIQTQVRWCQGPIQ